MELPRVDQPQAPDTVDKLLQGGKLSTAKKIQLLQAPVASLWILFSFSAGKVRVLAPLNRTAGLFSLSLSLQFSLIIVELLFNNMHPSITVYTLTHPFVPSGGFTYCIYPHALGQLLRQYYQVTISKENNQQLSVGMDDMLETDESFLHATLFEDE